MKAVLGYVVKKGKVLLTLKKRGFGKGKWNGFGGKVEKGESWEKALEREALEELGIVISNAEERASLRFFKNTRPWFEVKAYIIHSWEGEPKESDEVKPKWFPIHRLPLRKMWEDDSIWLPMVLRGAKVEGSFLFKGHKLRGWSLTLGGGKGKGAGKGY